MQLADASRVIAGCAHMGSVLPDVFQSKADRRRSLALLDGLLDAGCTAFDLAASYQLGGAERLFGAWIESRHNRDRVFLISKGGHPYPVVQPHRITPRALSSDLHASLRRLGTERVDLYLLHRDDEAAPLEPILETVTAFQRAGKVAAWGVSNWTHARVDALSALARSAGAAGAAASSPHFSLLEWAHAPWRGSVSITGAANAAARTFYQREKLPVLAWSPLGSGFFGREQARAVYAGAANARRRERAEELARKYGCTPAEVALAYLFGQPFPVFAVVATSSAEHMKNNLRATALHLSDAELRWLETGAGDRG